LEEYHVFEEKGGAPTGGCRVTATSSAKIDGSKNTDRGSRGLVITTRELVKVVTTYAVSIQVAN